MAPLRIEVNGDATIYRPAERAVMSIAVQSEGNSQEEVSRNVTTTSTHVRDLLAGIAPKDDKGQALSDAAITFWSNSSLSTGSFFRYEGEKQIRVHQAGTTFEAKFQDFAQLGAVATKLSTMPYVSVKGISWRLTDKTKLSVTTQCRHQAVQDAVAKARDYAAALDRPAPPVVEIRDSGFGREAYEAPAARMNMMAVYSSGEPTQEDLNFSPDDVSVSCGVMITCHETS